VGSRDHRKEDKLSRRRKKKSDPLLHDCWCGKVTQEQSGDLRKKGLQYVFVITLVVDALGRANIGLHHTYWVQLLKWSTCHWHVLAAASCIGSF
jgi:hypothetical protein